MCNQYERRYFSMLTTWAASWIDSVLLCYISLLSYFQFTVIDIVFAILDMTVAASCILRLNCIKTERHDGLIFSHMNLPGQGPPHWVADDDSRRRLRSSTSQQLKVRRTRLRTVGDRGPSSRRSSCVECAACIGRLCSVTDCLQESSKNASVSAAVL